MTPELLEQLISKHQRSLELFASQWTSAPEDCVQEAFLRLHRSDQNIANHRAWLFRVVRNLAIDQRRSEASRTQREQFVGRQRPMFSHDVQQSVDGQELRLALEALDDGQREIVVARIWGKLTLEEISESFGIAVSTVHRRYTTGIQKLQQHFEVPCQNRIQK